MGLVATTLTEPSEGRAHAIAFLIDAYHGVRTAPGKGLPHAQAVADILRDAGYDQRVQVVGLLHDVVEDTPRSIDDVRNGFGETIAAMVRVRRRKLAHYDATLQLAVAAGADEALCRRVAKLLEPNP
jgi:(p)ppGpp synthase/HD superfamily hydrolase